MSKTAIQPPDFGKENQVKTLFPPSGLPIYYTGPGQEQGPLPALFYFALSGVESLSLEPFNQPVALLKGKAIRVFSSSLPCHSPELKKSDAMQRWAEEMEGGKDIMGDFLSKCHCNLNFLIDNQFIKPTKIAAAGLSRGGFAAAHFAARDSRISHILGYAPLTELSVIEEFEKIKGHPIVASMDLKQQIPHLLGKKLRFYIGNLDKRVGTKECFTLISLLANSAYENKIRSPFVELIISPSIGYKGHGTPPEVFQAGINWIKKEFLLD